ncbi:hypothetical protein CR513_02320, partial [Mucuna pruriens]
MVLKRILPNVKDPRGKWALNYAGPYVVKQAFSGGALILTNVEGQDLKYPVNAGSGKQRKCGDSRMAKGKSGEIYPRTEWLPITEPPTLGREAFLICNHCQFNKTSFIHSISYLLLLSLFLFLTSYCTLKLRVGQVRHVSKRRQENDNL